MIREGTALVRGALARGTPGPYQVQAAVAALHGEAVTSADTDWPQIAALYDVLLGLRPTPVVAHNRAVALALATVANAREHAHLVRRRARAASRTAASAPD